MKTKKDYEDVWQKARFNQEIIYKNISGKPIQEKKKSYAREICLTIHHRVQGHKDMEEKTNASSTRTTHSENKVTSNADSTDAEKKVTES